jgi:creatinine amidohydrolase
MRFGSLTYLEIRERAREGWLAIVPTGCTEQQGPHLPVENDTWFAETVCLAGADEAARAHGVNALVLPAAPFGPTPEHRNYGAGFVDVPREIHEAYVRAVLESLADQGFGRIVVWRGCGGHDLHETVDAFNRTRAPANAFLPDAPYNAIWRRGDPERDPGGHADSFITSIWMHLRPHDVRTAEIRDPQNPSVDWDDPALDFAAWSATGVIGNPTVATADLGAVLWREVVVEVAGIFRDIAEGLAAPDLSG